MPSDLLGEESRLPRSPWQLSKPRCRVTGPPWLQLSKPARPTWGLGEPWPRLPLPHTPGSGSCHLVPDRQCVPPASCSGHGIPEDAAVATATKLAKPGARQGPSSEPQGWLPPLDSQTSQYKDLRSVCSPPVPGTHPTAAEGSHQPQLKPASDRACRPTPCWPAAVGRDAGLALLGTLSPRLWPFSGGAWWPRGRWNHWVYKAGGGPGRGCGGLQAVLLQQCGWAGEPRAHCHSCCTDRCSTASCAWLWASLLPRPLSRVYKVKLAAGVQVPPGGGGPSPNQPCSVL